MNPSGQPTQENAMWSEYIDQNTGAETAHLVVEADPALRLRESIEDGAAPARAESFTESGKPRSVRAPGRGAALAQRYCEGGAEQPPARRTAPALPTARPFHVSNPEPAAAR